MAQLQLDVHNYGFYELLRKERLPEPAPVHKSDQLKAARLVIERYHNKNIRPRRDPKLKWSKQIYIMLSILLGNGIDGLPPNIRLVNGVSAFIFYIVRFLAILLFAIPIMGIEAFLGRYTKLTNIQLYRMAPISYGHLLVSFLFNLFYIPFMISEVSVVLLGAIRQLINPEYMSTCPEESTGSGPACYDYKTRGSLINDTCVPDFLSLNCAKNGRIAYVAQYHFWMDNFDFEDGINIYQSWPIIIAGIITWAAIFSLVLSGMKMMTLVLILSTIVYHILLLIVVIMVCLSAKNSDALYGVVYLEGFPTLKSVGMVIASASINIKIVTPVGHMTAACLLKGEEELYRSSRIHRMYNPMICFCIAFLHMIYEAATIMFIFMIDLNIIHVYGLKNVMDAFVPNVGIYYAMIIEFLNFKQVTSLFKWLYLMALWCLEIVKLSYIFHFQVINFMDMGHDWSRFKTSIKILFGVAKLLVTLILLNIKFSWYISLCHLANYCFIEPMRMCLLYFLMFFSYGINRINSDLMFFLKKSILKYWRLMGPAIPVIYLTMFAYNILQYWNATEKFQVDIDIDVPYSNRTIVIMGISVCSVYTGIALALNYWRIVTSERTITVSSLLRPDFHWGPPDRERRQKRKKYSTLLNIRSSYHRRRMQRFRKDSIRQMHEQDTAEAAVYGRVFLDSHFYTHCEEAFKVLAANRPRYRTSDTQIKHFV